MEESMKFNSSVCTSIEQSQRLLELGLKPETADMYYFRLSENDCCLKVDVDNDPLKYNMDRTYIPAWSLHRLIEISDSPLIEFNVLSYNPYEEIISLISECIKNGYISKGYLKQ